MNLKAVKRWLNLTEHDCADDELIENEIIPVAVQLFEAHSGRIVGIKEVEQIYEGWPACFEFCHRPVVQLCGIWCARDGQEWTPSDRSQWVEQLHHSPPVLRPKCISRCTCKTVCDCECPTRWRIRYLAGQDGCTLRPIDAAWIKAVVAEFYRVREASLETTFTQTPGFARLHRATADLFYPVGM